MVARKWDDRIARLRLLDEQVIEGVARAIYMTHRKEPAPVWENARQEIREWVREQARSVLAHLRPAECRHSMVAHKWDERIARPPLLEEQVVESVTRAIYMTHRKEPAPAWEGASEQSREWVRNQARSALAYLTALTRPDQ